MSGDWIRYYYIIIAKHLLLYGYANEGEKFTKDKFKIRIVIL